jgi:hypothetical protein
MDGRGEAARNAGLSRGTSSARKPFGIFLGDEGGGKRLAKARMAHERGLETEVARNPADDERVERLAHAIGGASRVGARARSAWRSSSRSSIGISPPS